MSVLFALSEAQLHFFLGFFSAENRSLQVSVYSFYAFTTKDTVPECRPCLILCLTGNNKWRYNSKFSKAHPPFLKMQLAKMTAWKCQWDNAKMDIGQCWIGQGSMWDWTGFNVVLDRVNVGLDRVQCWGQCGIGQG